MLETLAVLRHVLLDGLGLRSSVLHDFSSLRCRVAQLAVRKNMQWNFWGTSLKYFWECVLSMKMIHTLKQVTASVLTENSCVNKNHAFPLPAPHPALSHAWNSSPGKCRQWQIYAYLKFLIDSFFFRSKVDQIHEIVTGNPTVIKMVVSFNRGARGQNALRQILAPVVKEIIDDKSLNIKTDPVDIYKSWVNQMESQTGEARYGIC